MTYYVTDRKTREAIYNGRLEQQRRDIAVYEAALAKRRASKLSA